MKDKGENGERKGEKAERGRNLLRGVLGLVNTEEIPSFQIPGNEEVYRAFHSAEPHGSRVEYRSGISYQWFHFHLAAYIYMYIHISANTVGGYGGG
jgi:hypothetical protein